MIDLSALLGLGRPRKLAGSTTTLHREVEAMRPALEHVRDWSLAIDGGAHVGVWTIPLAERFARVLAFEPGTEAFALLTENTGHLPNVEARNEALLERRGRVNSVPPRPKRQRLTSRIVERSRKGKVRAVAIDSLDLPACGLIKLDLEGAEPLALIGAQKTIERCRPVLIVETGARSRRFGFTEHATPRMIGAHGYREILRDGVNRAYVSD